MLSAFISLLLAMAPGESRPVHVGAVSGAVYRDCGGWELRRVQAPSMWTCYPNWSYYMELDCPGQRSRYSGNFDMANEARRRQLLDWLVKCEG